jgi:putative transcription factor
MYNLFLAPVSTLLRNRQIADYEAGRAIPNVALLAKIERAIGVKLRGDPKLIGTPLPGPGSKKK